MSDSASAAVPVIHGYPFNAMGTRCELKLAGLPRAQADVLAAQARAEVERLEAKYSRYRDDSLLAAINRVAEAGGAIDVDAETAALLDYAAQCHAQSGGRFDPSSGLLRRAWRREPDFRPDAAAIAALLDRIGWHRLQWAAPRLAFAPGMELDLGGIVKEYAADRVAALWRTAGVASGLVNLGGDLQVLGPLPDGTPWRIGVQDPRRSGEAAGVLELRRGAIATSGDYERCWFVDGVRHGHVFDPRSGWPVRRLASVSVVAPLCLVAGSAATIALLLEDEGPDWLAGLGLAHRWIDVDGRSGGMLPGFAESC